MKYDWITLEREFTTHKKYATISLREFAAEKGIPYGANYRKHSAGWLEKRGAKQARKGRKIEAALEAKEVSREVAVNERHTVLWNRFLDALENGFSDPVQMIALKGKDSIARTLRNLANVMEKAQKGQRLALGMDKEKQSNETEEANAAIESLLGKLSGRKVEETDDDTV